MSLATRKGTAEYAELCDYIAAAHGEPCVVVVDRTHYAITAPEYVFRAADREIGITTTEEWHAMAQRFANVR